MNSKCSSSVLVVIFFVVCALTLFPNLTIAADSGDEVKSLSRLLEQHYRRAQTLRALFLERYSESSKQARVESGTVYFKRPGRMRWDYDSPEKKLFLTDGKSVWFYVPYDHTVTKSPERESSDWRTPLSLLTGKADLNRLCSRIDKVTQPGVPAGHAVLRCLPKGSKSNAAAAKNQASKPFDDSGETQDFTDVLLEIDTGSGELARIEIIQPGGVQLEYRFGNWQTDIPLSDELFHFQAPSGVAIVNGYDPSAAPQ